MKRELSEIEAAKTASGQTPKLLEVTFNKNTPYLIKGTIMHYSVKRVVTWNAVTGECFFAKQMHPEHNLIFTPKK